MPNPRPKANADPLALDPGELRHLVSFAHTSASQDAAGQPLNTWTAYLSTWAKIENLSGQQLFQTNQFTSAAIFRFTTRYHATIQVGDRIAFGSHAWVVQIINNVLERNRKLELTCLEINGAS
jgi:SPP1 family predicted phage head-tail adaptor